MFQKYCKDCDSSAFPHIQNWLDEILDRLLPSLYFFRKLNSFFDVALEKFFVFIHLMKMKDDFSLSEIQMRSACFIKEGRKHGIKFKVGKGPFGYTNHFYAEIKDKKIRFESLPTTEHISKHDIFFTNCKERTRKYLKKGNFPVVEGKSFWFWQRKQAIKYGIDSLGFPLVVKPRSSSLAKHVTTNIENKEDLQKAINNSLTYAPTFIIEEFIQKSFIHRVTVVDFNYIACVKQIPANVTGDGGLTIQELINVKNKNRGKLHQKGFILNKIVINNTTKKLLAEKNYNLKTVLHENENVYLQEDPFLKLGGDLVEVTEKVNPDNIQLFKDIAIFFDIRLVGIDLFMFDVSLSWKKQDCVILELNSLPCIEMHHYPSFGKPQNVANALIDLFFKYYL